MKGNTAKENIIKKISQALGDDYIGEFNKKYYTWADDGGERIQICISLTCPKVYVGEENAAELNFDDEQPGSQTPDTFTPAAVTKKEQDTLADLMARLGL